MLCNCGAKMDVVDSRTTANGGTRRSRLCRPCDKRIFTLEIPEKQYFEVSKQDRIAKAVMNNLTVLVDDLASALNK